MLKLSTKLQSLTNNPKLTEWFKSKQKKHSPPVTLVRVQTQEAKLWKLNRPLSTGASALTSRTWGVRSQTKSAENQFWVSS